MLCPVCREREADTLAFGVWMCFDCYQDIKDGKLTCPVCGGWGFLPKVRG
jgi:ribosomal protein L37AE/L43A